MGKCNCSSPSDVFNGVCGSCLLPLDGVEHDDKGNIISHKPVKVCNPYAFTKGPWKAVRQGENFDGSTFYDPMDKEEQDEFLSKPFVRIVNSKDDSITTNHDLFTFKNPADAKLIAAAPDMYDMIMIIKEQAERGEIVLDKITMGSINQVLAKATK